MNTRHSMRSLVVLLPAIMLLSACHSSAPASPASPVALPVTLGAARASQRVPLNESLEAAFAKWEQLGPSGDEAHRARLVELVRVVRARLAESGKADLLFVCTHNSRRSHMAQLIGLAAASRNGLAGVRTFSGGTEATAFNPRAIAALGRVGFEVTRAREDKNPHYRVRYSASAEPADAFSKRFPEPPNPAQGFVAVMTCSQADAACPFVRGAVARLAVPYEDPKVADDTPAEAAKYDERVEQIGRDLAWVFAEVARS